MVCMLVHIELVVTVCIVDPKTTEAVTEFGTNDPSGIASAVASIQVVQVTVVRPEADLEVHTSLIAVLEEPCVCAGTGADRLPSATLHDWSRRFRLGCLCERAHRHEQHYSGWPERVA